MTSRSESARSLPTVPGRRRAGVPCVRLPICPDRDDAAALAALAVLRTLGGAATDAPAPVRRAVEMAEARRRDVGLRRETLKADAYVKLRRLLTPAETAAPRLADEGRSAERRAPVAAGSG